MTLTRSQIDKLSQRLRHASEPSEDDLRQLNALLQAHEQTLLIAGRIVHASIPDALHVAVRLKTARTTIEKLKRDQTTLSRVQDLAGIRVVVPGGRNAQDSAVRAITEEVRDAKTVDRREKPSHGYRAVHVIAKLAGHWVEIQVRTLRQHRWAEIFEKTADLYGRQIRYGQPPNSPAAGSGLQPADKLIESLVLASDSIAMFEEQERTLTRGELPPYVRRLDEILDALAKDLS